MLVAIVRTKSNTFKIKFTQWRLNLCMLIYIYILVIIPRVALQLGSMTFHANNNTKARQLSKFMVFLTDCVK